MHREEPRLTPRDDGRARSAGDGNPAGGARPFRPAPWATLCVVALMAGCAGLDKSEGTGGFRAMFDGKSLNGWRGDPALWSVQEGAITGTTAIALPENTFLIHDGEFSDFVVRLKYRFSTEAGNSGLQYRSRPDHERPYSVIGYQANVVTQDADRSFAMLWDERGRELLARCGEQVVLRHSDDPTLKGFERRVSGSMAGCVEIRAAVRPYPQWNDYVIVAYKNRLVHILNGRVTVDVTDEDPDGRAMTGFFALQIHRGLPMRVQFTDLQLRPLTSQPQWDREFGVLDATPAP